MNETTCQECGARVAETAMACSQCGCPVDSPGTAKTSDAMSVLKPHLVPLITHLVLIALAAWGGLKGSEMWDEAQYITALTILDVSMQNKAIEKDKVLLVSEDPDNPGTALVNLRSGFVDRTDAKDILSESDTCLDPVVDPFECDVATGFLAYQSAFLYAQNHLDPRETLNTAKEVRREQAAKKKEAVVWMAVSGLVGLITLVSMVVLAMRVVPKLRASSTSHGGLS
jgi:hypothetical protein